MSYSTAPPSGVDVLRDHPWNYFTTPFSVHLPGCAPRRRIGTAMTTHPTVIDHPARRLVVALPQSYDQAREQYETLVPQVDVARFAQIASGKPRWSSLRSTPRMDSCATTSATSPPSWPDRCRSGKRLSI